MTRPPMLDGVNYPYWKTKMRAYLKSIDERVWMAVSEGWVPPQEHLGDIVKIKSPSQWTRDEIELANFNSKALNAIFNAVSTNQMKVVANCEVAKDAWEKLKTKNEGTTAVKKSRLRSLAREFENLTMTEDESIADFHARLCDISNESYALGETYTNAKLVRKVLGSLPRRFKAKLTSIEEVHDVEDMDLDELIGSLQNYELTLKRWSKGKKPKAPEPDKSGGNLALSIQDHIESDHVSFDALTEEKAALLTRNYAKFLRNRIQKPQSGIIDSNNNKPSGSFSRSNPSTHKSSQPSGRYVLSSDRQPRGIQCRECSGFGHIQAECANTLRKKKALVTTWSDSDDDKASSCTDQSDQEKQVIAFLAVDGSSTPANEDSDDSPESDSESLDEQTAYEQMYSQWVDMVRQVKQLNAKNSVLLTHNGELNTEISRMTQEAVQKDETIARLEAELCSAKKSLQAVPSGSAALNHQLNSQKPYGDRTSVGYKLLYNSKNLSQGSASNTAITPRWLQFVPATNTETKSSDVKSHDVKQADTSGSRRFIPTCHFCHRKVHIRPRCYLLQSYLSKMVENRTVIPIKSSQNQWVPKQDIKSLVAHTSLAAFQSDQWYFDSGCSKHMTGNKSLLKNYSEKADGVVTFGDGNKGKIHGIGDLLLSDLPPVRNVLFVKGLKANLLSISQLCDDQYTVNFS